MGHVKTVSCGEQATSSHVPISSEPLKSSQTSQRTMSFHLLGQTTGISDHQLPRSQYHGPYFLNELIRKLDLTYQTCSFLLHAAQSVAILVSNQRPFIASKIEIRYAFHAASCNASSVTPRMWRGMTRRTRLPTPTIDPHFSQITLRGRSQSGRLLSWRTQV